MTRKSPHRHTVRKHKRLGKTVHSYKRGQGDRLEKIKKRRTLLKPKQEAGSNVEEKFYMSIEYDKGDSDSLVVNARTFGSAINAGMVQRRSIKPPHAITLTRSD